MQVLFFLGEYMLEIGDTSSFSPYQRGGLVTQVKVPQEHSYVSVRQKGGPKMLFFFRYPIYYYHYGKGG